MKTSTVVLVLVAILIMAGVSTIQSVKYREAQQDIRDLQHTLQIEHQRAKACDGYKIE